jgi:hypothetical protein
MLMQTKYTCFWLTSLVLLLGCGGNQTVMPSGELTEEQKAAYAADIASVEDQESQGKINQVGKKKK